MKKEQEEDVGVIYLDFPSLDCDGGWKSIGAFPRTPEGKAEALAFIRNNIGPCDDDGKIALLTNL